VPSQHLRRSLYDYLTIDGSHYPKMASVRREGVMQILLSREVAFALSVDPR
jgi:hypothetical protein